MRIGTWFVLLLLIGCAQLPLSMGPDTSPPIRSGKEEYAIRRTAQFLETEIGLEYTNRTGRAVYLPTCHRVHPPGLEKRVGGHWVRAYSPIVELCLGPPVVVQPGATYSYTLQVSAGLPGNNAYPKFEVPEVNGTYRLVWTIYRTWEPDGPGPGLGELLPLEERVSNEFRITD